MSAERRGPQARAEGKKTFPRALRIHGAAAFDLAFKSTGPSGAAGRASSDALLVLARKNDREESRLGVSIGRKFGESVARNRGKRLLREAYRLEYEAFPRGFDFVVVPRARGFPKHLEGVRVLLRELLPRAAAKWAGRREREGRR